MHSSILSDWTGLLFTVVMFMEITILSKLQSRNCLILQLISLRRVNIEKVFKNSNASVIEGIINKYKMDFLMCGYEETLTDLNNLLVRKNSWDAREDSFILEWEMCAVCWTMIQQSKSLSAIWSGGVWRCLVSPGAAASQKYFIKQVLTSVCSSV